MLSLKNHTAKCIAGSAGLMLLFASGCGSPGDRLVGKWKMDTEALSSAMNSAPGQEEGGAGGLAAGMGELLKGMLGSIDVSVDFQGSGAFTYSMNMAGMANSISGQWKFVRSDGDKIVISMSASDPKSGEQKAHETTVTFVDQDTIQMGMPAAGSPNVQVGGMSQAATFRRVKH